MAEDTDNVRQVFKISLLFATGLADGLGQEVCYPTELYRIRPE